jgi:hypothetical protein
MATLYNPALQEEPRNQRARVIPLGQDDSFLTWLETKGRLISSGSDEYAYPETEAEELAEIMEPAATYSFADEGNNLFAEEEEVLDLEV